MPNKENGKQTNNNNIKNARDHEIDYLKLITQNSKSQEKVLIGQSLVLRLVLGAQSKRDYTLLGHGNEGCICLGDIEGRVLSWQGTQCAFWKEKKKTILDYKTANHPQQWQSRLDLWHAYLFNV